MVALRDAAYVYLENGVPNYRRKTSRNGTRASKVERRDVDRRVMKKAMELVDGDIRRIKAIDHVTIEILPER